MTLLYAGDVVIESDLVVARLADGEVEELSDYGQIGSLALKNSRMIFLILGLYDFLLLLLSNGFNDQTLIVAEEKEATTSSEGLLGLFDVIYIFL